MTKQQSPNFPISNLISHKKIFSTIYGPFLAFSSFPYSCCQTKCLFHVQALDLCDLIWVGTGPLTAKLRWCLFSSVAHVSDLLELHNNNWASGILHLGPSESDVYSNVIQEAQSNDLLHTVRLSVRLDTPLHGNNSRGAKYTEYYASIVTHTVLKWLRSVLCRNRNMKVPSLACLFPGWNE